MSVVSVKLGSVTEEVKRRIKKNSDLPVYSVTKYRGFVPSLEYFKKQVFSRSTKGYKEVYPDEIAYATIHLDEGSVGLAYNQCIISPMYTVFQVDKSVDPNYLVRYLKSPEALAKYQILGKGTVHRRKAISFSRLASLKIPLPPLAEQKRIAAILDAADALRAKRRESLTQLDTLLQSTFLDMFGDPVTNPMGWEVGVIGDLLTSANYGTSKKADPEHGKYSILRMNNITYSGEWDFSSLKYINLDDKDLSKHLVYKGQILFNRTNSKKLVGKTAVYRRKEPMAFAGYLVRGIVNNLADPEYVGAFMNTPQTKQFLQNKCKSIVGMANINAKEFQAIPIQKPPIDIQRRFATIVESVEQQKARMLTHLAELDTLFASLQSRAFNGEL